MRSRGPSWPPRFPPHRRWEHISAPVIQAMFRRVFVRWGLPDRVRVDNGYPWGTSRDLPSELALWLIGLGVEPIWNPPGQPTQQSQGGAVQRPDPAVGRAAHLRRLPPGGQGVGLGRPDPTPRVPCDPRSDPHRGVPATGHAAACVSAGPRKGDVGSLPSGCLLSPGVLEAACRRQWSDLHLWAQPTGRSGLGPTRTGGAIRCILTVLVGLQSERGIGQTDAGGRTDPRANHGPRGQPPEVNIL